MDCIYDYPQYYDILAGWDRGAEASFYDAALRRHGAPHGGRLVEVGCGTGQITLRMARLGWEVTGLDVRQPMLDFLEGAAAHSGLRVRTVRADMTDFALPELQHCAICPIGSFAILQDDASALSHLRAVAGLLLPGAAYILDLGFAERDGEQWEEWSVRRGDIEVRTEGDRIVVADEGRQLHMTLGWGCEMRRYSGAAFAELVERSGVFRVETWYPEAARDGDGVSLFDFQHAQRTPTTGRSMVALRRCAYLRINPVSPATKSIVSNQPEAM